MATCKRDPSHVYPPHNEACPWCAIAATPPASASSHVAPQVALPPPVAASATAPRQTWQRTFTSSPRARSTASTQATNVGGSGANRFQQRRRRYMPLALTAVACVALVVALVNSVSDSDTTQTDTPVAQPGRKFSDVAPRICRLVGQAAMNRLNGRSLPTGRHLKTSRGSATCAYHRTTASDPGAGLTCHDFHLHSDSLTFFGFGTDSVVQTIDAEEMPAFTNDEGQLVFWTQDVICVIWTVNPNDPEIPAEVNRIAPRMA